MQGHVPPRRQASDRSSSRRPLLRRCSAALAAALALALPAAGQRFQTQVLTETEGLPSSRVLEVVQDHRGRLWISTRAGLTIYDGQRFKSAADVADVLPAAVTAIGRGSGPDMVLVGTGPMPQIVRNLGSSWQVLPSPDLGTTAPGQRRRIAVLAGGEILIAPAADGAVLWDGKSWGTASLPAGTRITALLAREDGALVGTTDGLFRLDASLTLVPHPASAPIGGHILALAEAAAGGVWLLARDWLGRLDGEATERSLDAERLPRIFEPESAVIIDDGFGGVFFGGARRLFQLDLENRRLRPAGVAEGLASEGAVDLLRDREGGIWLASGRGLSRIASQRFISYGRAQGLLEPEVTALLALPPAAGATGERLVLGHNRGFTFLEGDSVRTVELPGAGIGEAAVSRVLGLAADGRGRIWAAVSAYGLVSLEPSGRMTRYGKEAGIDLAQSVAIDAGGELWVATARQVLELRDGNFVAHSVPLPASAWLRWLTFIGDEIFLSSDRGLFWRLRSDSVWQHATSAEPGGNNVYRVLRDSRGRVWVGTGAGLFRLEGHALVRVREGALHIERPVYLLLEDAGGRLWFGSDNGAFVWDGKKLRNLDVRHGLAGRETNRGAGLADGHGQVWIGTERGLSVYQPRYDTFEPAPPVVELRRVHTSSSSFGLGAPLELDGAERNLTFYFEAVTLAPERGLAFRCRLLGFDTGWLDPCPAPSGVRYTNLPPDSYRFQVQARHDAGAWGRMSTAAPIRLRPPLWRSKGFVVAAALAAAFLALTLWRAFERKRHAADHDPLTGLPNRTWFFRRLGRAIDRDGRSARGHFAVLFLDLDGFKHVNDSLGHLVGDVFLVAIGERLQATIAPYGWAARIGGDEFALLIESTRAPVDTETVIAQVRAALAVPFSIAGRELFTDVSIGVVFGSAAYQRPEQVLRDADTAMYRAKAKGRGRSEIFDPAMLSHASARLDLETDLRRALGLAQLRLHYQPIVSADGETVTSVEALLRWNHPRRGRLEPHAFIDVAEETGFIVPIGSWVIHESFRQIAAWRQRSDSFRGIRVHVNVSAAQLHHSDLVNHLRDAANQHGVETSAISLELTERTLVSDLDSAARLLEALRDIGVATFLDDFGRGQTSLRYLRRLPLDGLKLDRSFVADLGTDPKELEIARMVIRLGRRLGLQVIAEGVETEEQLRLLARLRCHALQGFYFHRPMPPDAVAALLEARTSQPANV